MGSYIPQCKVHNKSAKILKNLRSSTKLVIMKNVLPIVEAGQAQIVDSNYEMDDNFWLESTPGSYYGTRCSWDDF